MGTATPLSADGRFVEVRWPIQSVGVIVSAVAAPNIDRHLCRQRVIAASLAPEDGGPVLHRGEGSLLRQAAA